MKRVIAIAGQKGGTGKSTTTLNLGAALQELGQRVLLIDMDPQASLTVALGIDDAEGASLAEVLTGTAGVSDVARQLDNGLSLLPSDINLSGTELWLASRMARESVLKNALRKIDGYDYILLDCPPSLGLLTINGLTASGEVIATFQAEFLAVRALALFSQSIDLTRDNLNPALHLLGCLPVMVSHTREHAEMLEAIGQRWPVIPIQIGRSIRLAEATRARQSILVYDPQHQAAVAYRELAAWVQQQKGKSHGQT